MELESAMCLVKILFKSATFRVQSQDQYNFILVFYAIFDFASYSINTNR